MPFKTDAPATYLSREDVVPSRIGQVNKPVDNRFANSMRALNRQALAALTTTKLTKEEILAKYKSSPLMLKNEEVDRLSARSSPPYRPLPHRSPGPSTSERRNNDTDNAEEKLGTSLSSDSDYELVPGPAPVEAFTSESESDTPLSPAHTTSAVATLPIRSLDTAGLLQSARRSDFPSDSPDSEWSLV